MSDSESEPSHPAEQPGKEIIIDEEQEDDQVQSQAIESQNSPPSSPKALKTQDKPKPTVPTKPVIADKPSSPTRPRAASEPEPPAVAATVSEEEGKVFEKIVHKEGEEKRKEDDDLVVEEIGDEEEEEDEDEE